MEKGREKVGGGHKYLTELSLGHGLTSSNIIIPTEDSYSLYKIFQTYFLSVQEWQGRSKRAETLTLLGKSSTQITRKNVLQFVSLQNVLTNTAFYKPCLTYISYNSLENYSVCLCIQKTNPYQLQRLCFSSAYCNLSFFFYSINCRVKAVYPSISQTTLNFHFPSNKIIAATCIFKKKKVFLLHGKYLQ